MASKVKPGPAVRRGSSRDARSILLQREHWFLLVLWVLSWTGFGAIWTEGPVWVQRGSQVGLVAFFGLVAWWAITGFSGYEHRAGVRIIRRPGGAAGSKMPLLVAFAFVVMGLGVLTAGFKFAWLVVAVALATGATIVLILIRRFSVFATLSIVGIAIGVAALIVVQSVATGFQHEFERRVLGVYAHINVTRSFGIVEYRRFESHLRTVDGVVGASPFVYYLMALAPYGREDTTEEVRRASVLVKGIEPTTAEQVIDLAQHLARGEQGEVPIAALQTDIELEPVKDREPAQLPPAIAATPDPRGEGWFEPAMKRYRALPAHKKWGRPRSYPGFDDDEWPDEDALDAAPVDPDALPTMFVGATLARELGLTAGDRVMLVDPGASFDHSEAPAFRHYRVAGVFRAGFQEYDTRLVYVHIRELQYFKYRGKDVVSGVDLRLDDPYEAPAVETILKRTIGAEEYSILEWQKLNANLFQSIRTQKSVLTVILSLVGAVAGFNVLAALWTLVVRRTAEIAILMSMGAAESGVARIFQFTGMTIGAVGCLAGVCFGLVLCWLVALYGYTLDPEVYFIERLPVEISVLQISVVVALTMGVSFLATIPPSLRAAKLRPVDGLRYE